MCFKGGVLGGEKGISTGFVSELLGSDMKTLEKIGGNVFPETDSPHRKWMFGRL